MKVWKYKLPILDVVTLDMPEGAIPLRCQSQHGQAALWCLVDESRPKAPRHFRIAGTGHDIDTELSYRYIDTFQMYEGDLVFHVFEELGGDVPR